jgi:hypothetical protein
MNKAMARQRFSAFIVLTAALLLSAPMAQAMKIQQQNLTQLITESQSIVHGTVKSVTDGIDANNVPYTEVTIAVGSAAKGNHEPESTLTFRQFGLLEPRDLGNGKLRIAMTPEGFPRWLEGETVVAFLRAPARITGLQTTAGVAQGKFTQVNDTLINGFNNVGLFDGVQIDDALLDDENRNMLTQPGAVDAAAFLELVGRAVEENWIENGEMQ